MKKLVLVVVGTLCVSGCAAYPVYPRYQHPVPYYRTERHEHHEYRHYPEHGHHRGHRHRHHDDD